MSALHNYNNNSNNKHTTTTTTTTNQDNNNDNHTATWPDVGAPLQLPVGGRQGGLAHPEPVNYCFIVLFLFKFSVFFFYSFF